MGWTTAQIPDLSDRTYIVTGANSGIGYEAALALAAKGARVVLACRTESKAREALDGVKRARGDARAEFGALDLASLKSVRAFAEAMLQRFPEGVDGLVNNAGVMATPRLLTEDGFEMQLGTNHLGHFLLTELLLGALEKGAPSRVVILSSCYHDVAQGREGHINFDDLQFERRPYDGWAAYAQSKLANLLHAKSLAARVGAKGITAKHRTRGPHRTYAM